MVTDTKQLWRTKYPWIIVLYIMVFSLITGVVKYFPIDKSFSINLLLAAALTSYIFLYIFYIFGVRPIELEHHFRK